VLGDTLGKLVVDGCSGYNKVRCPVDAERAHCEREVTPIHDLTQQGRSVDPRTSLAVVRRAVRRTPTDAHPSGHYDRR